MKKLSTLLVIFLVSYFIKAQDTFSIVAVDPVTGEIGSAGASCVDGIGVYGGLIDIITQIIPGRGGVNSQAWVCIPNVNLQNAITQMEAGLSPSEIIDWLINNDACSSQNFNPEYRQYGIADFDSGGNPRTAGFTGTMTDDYKEDRQGPTYSVQGNILLNQTVIDNMEDNFNNTTGTLADKLMSAMQGANFAGADSRCLARGTSSTSAYLLVYKENDDPSNPYLRLNIEEMPFGEEPIDSLQILYDNFLAVNEFDLKSKIRLYPNPATNEIIVSYDSTIILSNLAIFDINGKRIVQFEEFSANAFQQQIDVSSFQNGIYFLNIESLQGRTTLKFVKH